MKLIIAYIRPEALSSVKKSLFEKNVRKMSVTNVLGCGQQMGYHESYRGTDIEINLLKKIRLEIAVNDEFEEKTVDAICAGAKTGVIGDGKIFITNICDCVRIRTGEKGNDAIG